MTDYAGERFDEAILNAQALPLDNPDRVAIVAHRGILPTLTQVLQGVQAEAAREALAEGDDAAELWQTMTEAGVLAMFMIGVEYGQLLRRDNAASIEHLVRGS